MYFVLAPWVSLARFYYKLNRLILDVYLGLCLLDKNVIKCHLYMKDLVKEMLQDLAKEFVKGWLETDSTQCWRWMIKVSLYAATRRPKNQLRSRPYS